MGKVTVVKASTADSLFNSCQLQAGDIVCDCDSCGVWPSGLTRL